MRLKAQSSWHMKKKMRDQKLVGKSLISAISWGDNDMIFNSNAEFNTFNSFRNEESHDK